MFNLEQSITDWRQQMLAAEIQSPVPLEELEAHLREEIEQQLKLGISAQTAFLIAAERIGLGSSLKTEFKMADRLDRIQLRKKAAYFYAGILVFYSATMTSVMFKNDLSTGEKLLGLASLATLLLCSYLVWQIAPRFFPIITSRRVQSLIGISGGISGAMWFVVFANLILPHFNFTQGQLVVVILWAMVPTLILPNFAFMMIDKSENRMSVDTGR
jgi:hypothetical protein